MADYDELFELYIDDDFKGKVAFGLFHVITDILEEQSSTPLHRQRYDFARDFVQSQSEQRNDAIRAYVLIENRHLSKGDIESINNGDLKTSIENIINQLILAESS